MRWPSGAQLTQDPPSLTAKSSLPSRRHALRKPKPTEATRWLSDSFEVAELHVSPAYQGQGLGRSLLYTLTDGRAERNALLSTQDSDSPARHLYRSAGFVDLLTAFRFSGGDPPYAVMGAPLPLRARA